MQIVHPPEPRGLAEAGEGLSARRQKTRAKIMAAAVEMFIARGAVGASVEEISEHAGFTRGAFYSNFADKDALVLAVTQDYVWRIADAAPEVLQSAAESHPEPPATDEESQESLRATVASMLGRASIDHNFVIVIREMELYALRNPALATSITELQDECARYFSGILTRGLEISGRELHVPQDDAVELVIAAFTAMGFDEAFAAAARGSRGNEGFSPQLLERLSGVITLLSRYTGRERAR